MAGTAAGGNRRSRFAPYLLVAPGILWLLFFYVLPIGTLARTSVATDGGSIWASYARALDVYGAHFLRSFGYAALATLLAVLMGYPLAYVLAFRAGRFKNFLLGLVIGIVILVILGLILQWLWNTTLPEVLGVKPVTVVQAIKILFISSILFGGYRVVETPSQETQEP